MMRRRSMRRTPKRKGTWLNALGGDCAVEIPLLPCAEIQAADAEAFELILNPAESVPGQVESVGEVTLVRLVGDIVLSLALSGLGNIISVVFYEGIYISDIDSAGFIIPKNPASVGDSSSADWMWRRTTAFLADDGRPENRNFINTRDQSDGAHLDVRVKRKLRREEGIFYGIVGSIEALTGIQATSRAWLNGNARAYVLLP